MLVVSLYSDNIYSEHCFVWEHVMLYFLNFSGDTHGNVMASVQDSRGNLRRLQTLQNNMERVLAEKFKELDTMNTQVKVRKQILTTIH